MSGRQRPLTAQQGLRYVSDREPGIRRVRRGGGFIYLTPEGTRIRDRRLLGRIRALAIPPAYRDVWVCRDPRGHLQATGRDARGRKQYRYHPRWRAARDTTKFHHVLEFGRVLPRIRRHIARDLALAGLPRAKVIATIVRLLQRTHVRVGNEEYARSNGSFGLTTLRDRHVKVRGERLTFEFRGKSGVQQHVTVDDPLVARVVSRCHDLPGQELFQSVDAQGLRHRIDSSDVNEYLRAASGSDFTAKDFRTWFATVQALEQLRALRARTAEEAKRQVLEVVRTVAQQLGNTPSVCRKCYIHPVVLECHVRGTLPGPDGRGALRVLQCLLRVPARARRRVPTSTYRFSRPTHAAHSDAHAAGAA